MFISLCALQNARLHSENWKMLKYSHILPDTQNAVTDIDHATTTLGVASKTKADKLVNKLVKTQFGGVVLMTAVTPSDY